VDRLRSENRIDFVIANGYTLTRPHDLNLAQFVHAAWQRSGLNAQAGSGLVRKVYQAFYTRYNAYHEKRSYNAARIIVAPSIRTLEEVRSIGIDSSKLRRIPNGVDGDEFSPGPSERTALGLPENVPMAMFAGDIRTHRKGLGSVLQAMVKLSGVHLAVVGRSDGSPFVPMAESLGLKDRVHFMGFRKDVPRILRSCDLFVFPSWYDPFGLVVTEALACGIPVVTTAATGAGELLNPECGTVIEDPHNIQALAAAMDSWLSDTQRRRAAVPTCLSIAGANGWTAMATQYLNLLEDNQPRPFPVAQAQDKTTKVPVTC
jgi:glycosyltransferase involved in cell wall biosynthesis